MTEQTGTQREIIARYASGIQAVDDALVGLTEADLDLARAEEKWTIREIVHHIADAEDLWNTACKSALGNCGCLFDASWYIIDNKWAEPLHYATRPIDEAFELYRAIRHQVLEGLQVTEVDLKNDLDPIVEDVDLGNVGCCLGAGEVDPVGTAIGRRQANREQQGRTPKRDRRGTQHAGKREVKPRAHVCDPSFNDGLVRRLKLSDQGNRPSRVGADLAGMVIDPCLPWT